MDSAVLLPGSSLFYRQMAQQLSAASLQGIPLVAHSRLSRSQLISTSISVSTSTRKARRGAAGGATEGMRVPKNCVCGRRAPRSRSLSALCPLSVRCQTCLRPLPDRPTAPRPLPDRSPTTPRPLPDLRPLSVRRCGAKFTSTASSLHLASSSQTAPTS